MVGNIMFKIVNLEIGCPISTPIASKHKLSKLLKKYGYNEVFIDSINDDMVIGYYVAKEIVKDIASDSIETAWESQNEVSDELAMEYKILCNLMSQMETFGTPEKTLKELLMEHERDSCFVDGLNADVEFGMKLGIEILMKAFTPYRQKLEARME